MDICLEIIISSSRWFKQDYKDNIVMQLNCFVFPNKVTCPGIYSFLTNVAESKHASVILNFHYFGDDD